MTTVVALIGEDRMIMGADSVISFRSSKRNLPKEFSKIIRKGNMLIGHTGEYRDSNVLRYALTLPSREDWMDDDSYMFRFTEVVRDTLHANRRLHFDDGIPYMEGELLAMYNHKLYRMWGDFSFTRLQNGYDAVGNGGDVALGVMSARYSEAYANDGVLEQLAEAALKASINYNNGVGEPLDIVTLRYPDENSSAKTEI